MGRREDNLKPLGSGKLTPEEELEIRRKGRKQQAYSEKMKKLWQAALNMPMHSGEKAHAKSMDDINENLTVGERMVLVTILRYMNTGDPKLLEQIMKYSGSIQPEKENTAPEPEQPQENLLIAALNRQAEDVWKDEPKDEDAKE